LDRNHIIRADDARSAKHPRMCERSLDVMVRQPSIESHRCCITLHQR
jgi:hypothetical protein